MLGLLLGAVVLWFEPGTSALILGAAVLVLIGLKRPELGLIGILVFTSTLVPVESLPLVSIGVGSLSIADLLLLALLALIVVRSLGEKQFRLARTPLALTLIGFYAFALIATALAIVGGALEFKPAIKEIRLVTYYLLFFATINLVRERGQFALLQRLMLGLASLVAAAMLLQHILGASIVILPGRVETLRTQDLIFSDVVRILPPGQSLVLVGFVVVTMRLCLQPLKASHWHLFANWGLLGLGVILTFNRVYWVGVALAILAALYAARGESGSRLLTRMLAVGAIAALCLLWLSVEPTAQEDNLISAVSARAATLVSGSAGGESSIEFRVIENSYALPHLLPPPLFGMGLGAQYRPFTELDWEGYDGRGYLHNGHLWLLIKAGLASYGCFMIVIAAGLWRGFRYWSQVRDPETQALVLGFTLSLLIVVVGSLTSPMVMEWHWAPVTALMLGLNEIVYRSLPLTPQPVSRLRGA